MQCSVNLASGRSCQREALLGSDQCAYHAGVARRREARAFYTTHLSPDEQDALAVAAHLEGIDSEIAILRVLIRRVLTEGDIESARRGIETLCRTLKARHDLDDQTTGKLASSLERVLDSLGTDQGAPQ